MGNQVNDENELIEGFGKMFNFLFKPKYQSFYPERDELTEFIKDVKRCNTFPWTTQKNFKDVCFLINDFSRFTRQCQYFRDKKLKKKEVFGINFNDFKKDIVKGYKTCEENWKLNHQALEIELILLEREATSYLSQPSLFNNSQNLFYRKLEEAEKNQIETREYEKRAGEIIDRFYEERIKKPIIKRWD